MIHYTLSCENAHRFDGWFRNAAAYEVQSGRGVVTCPVCASTRVSKALMAPSLPRRQPEKVALSAGHPEHRQLRAALEALRDKVRREADYVGDRFAEEARRIHFNETEARGIYGEATREEVSGLIEDGVDFMPLPHLPEEHN